MPLLTLTGADIKVYINNKVYPYIQALNLSVDYGETENYGIDAIYAQEITATKLSVRGSVQGLRVKMSGGLQAMNMRPLFVDIAPGNYVSIRIQDRSTSEDIVFIPSAKITRENHSIGVKQTYKLNFEFVGQIPLFALDRSDDKLVLFGK
jgi:hypothetical protein